MFVGLARPLGDMIGFVLFAGLGMASMYVYYATVYAAIQDVVEPSLRGTAMALYFFAMYVLGASFGPLGTGMLSDYYAKQAMAEAGARAMAESFRAVGLHRAMYVIPGLSLILAAVLFAASRTVAADMGKLRRWMQGLAGGPPPFPPPKPAAGGGT